MVHVVLDDKVDKPDPTALANSTVCLIRHATTPFNIEF